MAFVLRCMRVTSSGQRVAVCDLIAHLLRCAKSTLLGSLNLYGGFIVSIAVRGYAASMPNFWTELPKPFFALAPLEDVTDAAFRRIIALQGRLARTDGGRGGPDVTFCE